MVSSDFNCLDLVTTPLSIKKIVIGILCLYFCNIVCNYQCTIPVAKKAGSIAKSKASNNFKGLYYYFTFFNHTIAFQHVWLFTVQHFGCAKHTLTLCPIQYKFFAVVTHSKNMLFKIANLIVFQKVWIWSWDGTRWTSVPRWNSRGFWIVRYFFKKIMIVDFSNFKNKTCVFIYIVIILLYLYGRTKSIRVVCHTAHLIWIPCFQGSYTRIPVYANTTIYWIKRSPTFHCWWGNENLFFGRLWLMAVMIVKIIMILRDFIFYLTGIHNYPVHLTIMKPFKL